MKIRSKPIIIGAIVPNHKNTSTSFLIPSLKRYYPIAVSVALVVLVLPAIAVGQCNEGCDETNDNTFLGDGALQANMSSTGIFNVAVGVDALYNNSTGDSNTAVGAHALSGNQTGVSNTAVGAVALDNTTASGNTAVGSGALEYSSTGENNTGTGAGVMSNANVTGSNNTADGYDVLFNDTSGSNNTATGYQALFTNTTGGSNTASGYDSLVFNNGSFNTATGRGALYHNTTANNNVATGYQALNSNKTGTANTATGTQALQADTGSNNTADGYQALNKNTVGIDNVASGYQALLANTSGITNTAVGAFALQNSQTGVGNIAIGFSAGTGVTSGSNNIDIANTGANESSTIRIGSANQTNTYIAGISGVTVAGGIGVIVDSSGHLGTSTSSARYKENVQPMDKASEAILSLQPVTFRYKHELDPKAIRQFGLVAEQVEKVDPDLVARDEQGKPYSVRYEAVNAMLLNEFLKEHQRVEQQQKEIQALRAELKEQRILIQRVSDKNELTKSASQMVSNRP
jgi:trimeric autotransporter adhesin